MSKRLMDTDLAGLDRGFLQDLVQQATDRPAAKLVDGSYEPIKTGMGPATGGVYRLEGVAVDASGGEEQVAWSLILKVLRPAAPGATDIGHPLYWRREAEAYGSGLLDDLPGPLRPARCYAIEDTDHETRLWLEDARRNALDTWPEERYREAAYALGVFNGAYVAGGPTRRAVPDYPWLTRDGSPRGVLNAYAWLRDLAADPAIWRDPLVAAAFPGPAAKRLVRLWDEREALLRIVEGMPGTLCHHDAWRGNIFIPAPGSPDPRLILIDWAYVGHGPLGADAGDLLGAGYGLVDGLASGLRGRAAVICAGYEGGLRAAGWDGDGAAVRRAILAFAAAKYGCLQVWLAAVQDTGQRARWEEFSGYPFQEYLTRQARALEELLDLADEARQG